MKWTAALVVWYALLVGGFVLLQRQDPPQPHPLEATDWERAAICVWERWDAIQRMTYQETGRIIRFCVTIEPHSLTPGLPSPTP